MLAVVNGCFGNKCTKVSNIIYMHKNPEFGRKFEMNIDDVKAASLKDADCLVMSGQEKFH